MSIATKLLLDERGFGINKAVPQPFECISFGEETDLQFVRCLEEVDYEQQLVELLVWMCGKR